MELLAFVAGAAFTGVIWVLSAIVGDRWKEKT